MCVYVCVRKKDYPLSRQVETKQERGEGGKGTIILLSWNKVQKQQNKAVERNEACNDSRTLWSDPLLMCTATTTRGLGGGFYFGEEFSWPACARLYRGKTDDIAEATKHLVNVTGH